MPPGIGFEWSGRSYQERLSGDQAPLLYAVSVLFIFLCLAALYESWSVPFSVMLVVPLGILGALIASHLGGQNNDVFFQVGLLTTVGLSAKNAILIVEFAQTLMARGMALMDAVLLASRQRLRPILMTSLAFMMGVLPLAYSSGAGSGSQKAIGFGVLGGMASATCWASSSCRCSICGSGSASAAQGSPCAGPIRGGEGMMPATPDPAGRRPA